MQKARRREEGGGTFGSFWDISIQIGKPKIFQQISENANIRFDRVVNSVMCGTWTDLHSPTCDEPGASDESD